MRSSGSSNARAEKIFRKFEQFCDEQSALCAALETIADALPDDVDRQNCIHVARVMGALIGRAHDFEETELFPLVTKSRPLSEADSATLERLKFEHYEDECFAEEVYEALMQCGSSAVPISADALGYMLRGFFVSLRRHIAFEREFVYGLAFGVNRDRDIQYVQKSQKG